jgi:transposase-like protein
VLLHSESSRSRTRRNRRGTETSVAASEMIGRHEPNSTGRVESEVESLTTPPAVEETSSVPIRGRSPLRRLSDEQELELTRLYKDTDTSVPDIARQFGIGESSVYRIAQRHGAPLRTGSGAGRRGRRRSSEAAAGASSSGATRRARRTTTTPRRSGRVPQENEQARPRSRRTTRRQQASIAGSRRSSQGQSAGTASRVAGPRTRSAAGSTRRFRVVFLAETIVAAGSIRDAIAQAEAQGATEITSVTPAE